MKTKNIFRMLLVAVALLLGANNVMALPISQNITGKGTVTTNPSSEANQGETVTITAIPDTGYELTELIVRDEWYQEVTLTDNTFVMPDKPVTVYATFSAIHYNITINSCEHGSLYVDDQSNVTYGATISIRAQADNDYELESINVVDANNVPINVSSDLKFTMPASDVTISGTFRAIAVVPTKYKLTYYTTKDNVSTLYKEYEIDEGAAIPTEPDPAPITGYAFGGWENVPQTMPNNNVEIYGTFTAINYTITANTPEHGSISLPSSAHYNDVVSFYYIGADNGYELDNIVVTAEDNSTIPVSENNTFIMPAQNVTVNVTFKPTSTITYNIWNANDIQNGSVSANPTSAEEGTTITLSCQPNTGYELDYYIVTDTENNPIEVVNGNQFTMPANNVWISAVFKQINYTVTINETTNGTVSADKTTNVHYNDEVTLTVTPAEGYELDVLTVKDANNNNVNVNNNKFNMPASDVTVTATFKETGSGSVGPTIPEDIENEHRLWTGPESAEGSDGHVYNLTANLFADIKTGDSFRVYVSDINNDQNWKLYITDNVNSWGSQVFDGFTGGDILRDNGGSTYYHTEDGYGYFEFTCTDQSVTNFKNNGTQLSFQWMTVTKVTYISNNIPEPTKYAITVSPTTNGTVTASAQSAAEGTTVTLTISPASGYEVDAISVKDANNANVTVNMSNYTFTMPATAVTVTVTFKQTTPNEYTITLSYDSSQGSVTLDSKKGKAGDTKWIYITPNSNYEVSSVTTNPYITVIHYGDYQGSDAYYFTMPEGNVTVYVSFQLKYRSASIGSSGYATFSCDEALNFAGITSLRAYIAKSIDANWVVLEQVTGTVAANTGLVIVGTTTNIPVANSGTSYSNNLLVPGNGTSVGGTGIYVLTNESGSVKFADTSAHSATVPVGKAYLQAPGTSAARLNIRWEGDATGIKVLKSDFNMDDTIYDLNGQRVVTPSKGLYIINGKKVVIK